METKTAVKYLDTLVEGVPIAPSSGTETFRSSGVFPGGAYGVKMPAPSGRPTGPTLATVHKQKTDGRFLQIFGELGEERLCWQESQVVAFCRDHPEKLRTGGYGTFFEMDGGFVAGVALVRPRARRERLLARVRLRLARQVRELLRIPETRCFSSFI